MIKKLLINVLVAGLLFLLIIFSILDGDFTELNIQNSLFVAGFLMASVGLLSLTNVGSMFRGFNFAFKKFLFKKYQNIDYYEYSKQRDDIRKRKEKPTGWAALLVGLVIIIVSIFIF